jgi:16S rRNA (cytosine967-C5)-methyltransferase
LTDGVPARAAALHILSDIARGTHFDSARDRHLAGLPDADRRLAHEIAAGVLRTRATLDATLAPLTGNRWRRLPPRLRDVLRVGAYQLVALDRVPPHAAVSTTVALARTTTGAGAAKLVNAVLRRVATERSDPAPPPPDRNRGRAAELAQAHSHPEWLVARWLGRFGPVATEALLQWNDERPPLVLQPLGSSVDALLEFMGAAGVSVEQAPYGAGVVVSRTRPQTLPGYAEGRWIVQDCAQALVLAFAAIPKAYCVYDACAAPGGKAAHLAAGRRVIAGDRTRARVARLRENASRVGITIHLIVADAAQPPVRTADCVFIDAPCTATGTLRRHPDARVQLTPRRLETLVRLQRRLLDAAAAVVRPGGLLVYVTCSLEPEENAEQVESFLREHPGYRRTPGAAIDPASAVTPVGDLELLPQRHGTDGAYAARLERTS